MAKIRRAQWACTFGGALIQGKIWRFPGCGSFASAVAALDDQDLVTTIRADIPIGDGTRNTDKECAKNGRPESADDELIEHGRHESNDSTTMRQFARVFRLAYKKELFI